MSDAAAQEDVILVADEPSRRQKLIGMLVATLSLAFNVLWFVLTDSTFVRALVGASSVFLFLTILAALVLPRRRWLGAMLLGESSWCRRNLYWLRRWQKKTPPSTKRRDYDDHPFLRFDSVSGTGQLKLMHRVRPPRTLVVLGRPLSATPPNVLTAVLFRRVMRPLYEDMRAGRDVLPTGAANPSFSRIDTITHCGDCGYVLRGVPGRVCPECGWAWAKDDLLIYGRRGPTAGGSSRGGVLKSLLLVSAASLGGGLLGATLVLAPMMAVLWAWRNLPPGYSVAAVASIVMAFAGGLVWLFMRLSLVGEAAREKAQRLGDVATAPAGQGRLHITNKGIGQSLLGVPLPDVVPWDEVQTVRVQHWPGGVRVRCDRRGKPYRWWRRRPVDFLCDVEQPLQETKRFRRSVSVLQRAHMPPREAQH